MRRRSMNATIASSARIDRVTDVPLMPPPSPAPVPPPASKTRMIVLIVVGVLVAAAVAVGVFALLRFLDPADKFPDSSTSDTPAGETVLYSSSDHGYSVEFPGEPTESSQTVPIAGHDIVLDTVGWESGDTAFAANVAEFPAELVGEVGAMLSGSVEGAVANIPGAELISKEEIQLAGLPAIRGEASSPSGPLTIVVAFDGPIQYQLFVLGVEPAEADPFFDSFRLD
jgi:hypothetical protein